MLGILELVMHKTNGTSNPRLFEKIY